MSGKANAVFWIGLILIFLNFWVTGQSTTFWSVFTSGSGSGGSSTTPPKKQPPTAHNPKGLG